MNGVEGTIFTLMAAYVVFIDTAGSVLVVVLGGGVLLGSHWQEGLGEKETEGKAASGWGRGERGAWGLGGGRQEQYCCRSTPGACCQPEQKGRVSNSGGWGGREPPPAPILQPLPVNPYSATLLKRGGASGVSPHPRSIQR